MKYLVQLKPDVDKTIFEDTNIEVVHHYEFMKQYLVEMSDEQYNAFKHAPYVLSIELDTKNNKIL
ncbi:hypothetical protein [Macrococcus armenti]|uniref:hypothetical protein n=1 Tax=Macrococcus armenti TaxID=2875764 RepID=UPI001CCACDAD|nr:hypothetical protein [Macrococcus armenti]UBH08072.1 hypothetical protein LAU41_08580 [Macrococcus armenti]UBH10304.1 hypothetical protein LAU38_08505 [Macrococcus armenti]